MSGRWIEYMPLAEVTGADSNPKKHARDQIRASISRFGLAELMVLDERTGRLVAGHGRLEQLKRLAAAGDVPDGVEVDPQGTWLVPVVRGWVSKDDAQAATYVITSNELTTAGGWDDDGLVDILGDLQAIDPALVHLAGYTDEQIDRLLGGGPDLPSGDDDHDDEEPKKMMDPGVLITCADETDQKAAYEKLVSRGYEVRVVNA